MKPRTKWAIIITWLFLFYGITILWSLNNRSRPYEKPPARTMKEQKAVDQIQKKVGNYTTVNCPEGIYFKLPGGKRWVVRRVQ